MGLTRPEALRLCERVRKENRGKLFSAARRQCWGCMRFGGEEAEKRCMYSEDGGYDSCPHVNKKAKTRSWRPTPS